MNVYKMKKVEETLDTNAVNRKDKYIKKQYAFRRDRIVGVWLEGKLFKLIQEQVVWDRGATAACDWYSEDEMITLLTNPSYVEHGTATLKEFDHYPELVREDGHFV